MIMFDKKILEEALNYYLSIVDDLEDKRQQEMAWVAINTIKYSIEHNSAYIKTNSAKLK